MRDPDATDRLEQTMVNWLVALSLEEGARHRRLKTSRAQKIAREILSVKQTRVERDQAQSSPAAPLSNNERT